MGILIARRVPSVPPYTDDKSVFVVYCHSIYLEQSTNVMSTGIGTHRFKFIFFSPLSIPIDELSINIGSQ